MTDNLLNTAVFALIAAVAIAAATIEIQAEWPAQVADAQTAQPVSVVAQEVVTLPEVTVIGQRVPQAAMDKQNDSAQSSGVTIAASEH